MLNKSRYGDGRDQAKLFSHESQLSKYTQTLSLAYAQRGAVWRAWASVVWYRCKASVTSKQDSTPQQATPPGATLTSRILSSPTVFCRKVRERDATCTQAPPLTTIILFKAKVLMIVLSYKKGLILQKRM